jgi:hypothetical protein
MSVVPFRHRAFAVGQAPAPILFTATPFGVGWRIKIVEGGHPRYEGNYPSRADALRDAHALAIEAGGHFLR